MIKKITLILLIFLLFSQCGYQPIYSTKNINFNINKLEKFLKEKMPNWELIFLKKAKKIIRNYHNN